MSVVHNLTIAATDFYVHSHETVAQYVPIFQNEMLFASTVASFILFPILFLLVLGDWRSNLPPRYSILFPALLGKFNLAREGPLQAIRLGYKKCGDIFRMKLLTQGFTFFIGPEASATFFDASDKDLSQREVYRFTVPVFGPNIVYDAPASIMIQQLKFVRHGLTGKAMESHTTKIIEEVEQFFSTWGDEGTLDLFHELEQLTICTAARCLLGDEVRSKVRSDFGEKYKHLNDGMTHLSVFFPNAPTKAHKLRDESRAEIAAIFKDVITSRKERQANDKDCEIPTDFMQMLIDSKYRDGTSPTDDEIVGMLLAGLFAGQHTSSITSTWLGLLLIRNKDIVPRLIEEQKNVIKETGNQLTFEALNKMPLMNACMRETLRLFPPLVLLLRKVKNDIKYKNYTVPKGDIAVVCPPVTHRDTGLYTKAGEFDPDRYARGEGREKHSFQAFGGGRHSCLGEKFGFMQVMTIWSVLLRRYDFTMEDKDDLWVDYKALVVGPGNNCKVSYKRKEDAF